MTLRRFSSRTQRLDQSFLAGQLQGAKSYRRIAGYFTSSLFEVAHEWLEYIPDIKIVCNVDVHPDDLKVAQCLEAKMLGRWHANALEAEALLNRDRYRRLAAFLQQRGQVIRVAPDNVCGFLHGKAGVIVCADGRKVGFMGSMNETRSGWQQHYEILWEDDSPEGVAWLEAEFNFLWNAAKPLPEAVCKEVRRRSHRHEIGLAEVAGDDDIAPAALIESPLYREGMALQPWQQSFVTECLKHYREYGIVRLLLADEVGLGKTLSLATAALALCLLHEKEMQRRKPVIIFAPATLCEQWQTELLDKLGIPTARWHTTKKFWLDSDEHALSPTGAEYIAVCPLRIGIVSTGLMLRDSKEKQHLLDLRYSLVILDEAHKARSRQGFGKNAGEPNELLAFISAIAARSDHVLLGTATPIQTKPEDLWDLVRVLHQVKGNFVLGNDYARWHKPDEVLAILSGAQEVTDLAGAWELLRSPLPPVNATDDKPVRQLYSAIRQDLGLSSRQSEAGRLADLDKGTRQDLELELGRRVANASFFQRENPLVRHVVLRKRTTLEQAGLLKRVGVDVHPDANRVQDIHAFNALFEGLAVRTDGHFREAYQQAISFGKVLGKRGGFMKNLMQQRLCSSVVAGVNTATALLEGRTLHAEGDDWEEELALQTDDERAVLELLLGRLKCCTNEPKYAAVLHYLVNEGWLEQGCIIFSQYYDTARWLAEALAGHFQDEAIGLYAGAGRSRLYQQGDSVGIKRETLKLMVAEHQIRIMVATDAACEGLNLQTLGTLINIDLPWNPTKLEQRIGRIKRFGQVRDSVDMLNLVNEQTVDEKVYGRLSERMRDKFNLFGSLPDTIKDSWIEDIETLDESMDQYIDAQKRATGFDLRYNSHLSVSDKDWRDCSNVLSQRDFGILMREGWEK